MRMSSFDFTDKTVIVTGGGTGIGFKIANSFVSCGAKVTIVGRRKDIIEKALLQIKKKIPKSEDNIISLTCDMSNEQSVSDLFQTVQSTFNNIDILINNCGTWSLGQINELKDSEIDAHFNNILKSTILATKYAAAHLGESGAIVNVGSFAGILPMKNASIYSSFKSAINVFTKSSATEFGKSGIRVNCITPGVIRTPMTSQYIDNNYNKIIEPIALGRVGSCEEVANAVLFLCSDLASYVTRTLLEVTGGKYTTQL